METSISRCLKLGTEKWRTPKLVKILEKRLNNFVIENVPSLYLFFVLCIIVYKYITMLLWHAIYPLASMPPGILQINN